MKRQLFIEAINALGLPANVTESIISNHDAIYEHAIPQGSVVMDNNIYNAIERPMGTASSHSNDVGSYPYPYSKSTSPNATRDYRQEAKQLFSKQVSLKKTKINSDPFIANIIKGAKKKIPARLPVNAVGTSVSPMVTGYSSPNRMNYSPYKQGCEAGGDTGGGSSPA